MKSLKLFLTLSIVFGSMIFFSCKNENYNENEPTDPKEQQEQQEQIIETQIIETWNEEEYVQTVSGTENERDYVDLGLSVKWATCNVGATKPENYGNYYAWGETKTKSYYDLDNYKYVRLGNLYGNSVYLLTKYCTYSVSGYNGFTDNKKVLDLTDDAARVNWGGNWRMPTKAEWQELIDNCVWKWIIMKNGNGVKGAKITSKNGNSIFLPCAGNYYKDCRDAGERGYYQSSSLYENIPGWAESMCFGLGVYHLGQGPYNRVIGHSVRAVVNLPTPSEPEPEPEPTVSGTENGHDYVDMGAAGLWATMNVGATAPEEYGNYYAWGETTTKSDYSWATYLLSNNGTGSTFNLTKYCNSSGCGYNGFTDTKTVLDPEDDAARANWGGKWRMPTKTEWQALIDNCTWTKVKNGGNFIGYQVTATNGNTLFLPAAGLHVGTELYFVAEGYYWSSSLYERPYGAWYLDFYSIDYYVDKQYYRCYGRSVRAVCDK